MGLRDKDKTTLHPKHYKALKRLHFQNSRRKHMEEEDDDLEQFSAYLRRKGLVKGHNKIPKLNPDGSLADASRQTERDEE